MTVEVSVRRMGRWGQFWDESLSHALRAPLLASMVAIPFLRLRWSTFAAVPPLSPELLLVVLCLRVLQLFLCFGLSSSDVWCCRRYLAACALLGECFVVVAA